ncbi:beta-lactamase-like protein [Armillaria mellea]|nr:beta-lactamase-like protein [Armillaria mellea]
MPPGTPYNSFLVEYPTIRIDEFMTPKNDRRAQLYLLTHTHSDHIVGLQAKGFGETIYCSHDSKEMLLRHEAYEERALHGTQLRAEKMRTYGHLKIDPLVGKDGEVYYQGTRDLLKVVPINSPVHIELDAGNSVTVTAIDANHCPGSVMYLIEGKNGAVLHTGDLRAEPWFLESLKRNPFLQPYLSTSGSQRSNVIKPLEAIYLDTACVMNVEEVPTKEDAVNGLIALMQLLPESTHFFINSWTWGYEDALKAIARAFDSRIHMDRYKHDIYSHLANEPLLRSICTRDAGSTRFHACERFERCEYVDVPASRPRATSTSGNQVVYINPVSTMNKEQWAAYQHNTRLRIVAQGEPVTCLLVPLARHSPLPELQRFVSLFRPKAIVPNTLDPSLNGLDWTGIRNVFSSCLSSCESPTPATDDDIRPLSDLSHDEDGIDVAHKNLVGDEADEAANKWADGRGKRRKLEVLRSWLGLPPLREITTIYVDEESQGYDSSSDADDERGKTAHQLFAHQAGIQLVESQAGSSSLPPSSPLVPMAQLTPLQLSRIPQLPSPSSSPTAVKRALDPSPSSAERPAKRPRLEKAKPKLQSPTPRRPTPPPMASSSRLPPSRQVDTFRGRKPILDEPSDDDSSDDSADERGRTAHILFGGGDVKWDDDDDDDFEPFQREPQEEESETPLLELQNDLQDKDPSKTPTTSKPHVLSIDPIIPVKRPLVASSISQQPPKQRTRQGSSPTKEVPESPQTPLSSPINIFADILPLRSPTKIQQLPNSVEFDSDGASFLKSRRKPSMRNTDGDTINGQIKRVTASASSPQISTNAKQLSPLDSPVKRRHTASFFKTSTPESAQLADRIRLAEQISKSNPELVSPAYPWRNLQLKSRHLQMIGKEQIQKWRVQQWKAYDEKLRELAEKEVVQPLNRDRVERIKRSIKEALRKNEKISMVMPNLMCTAAESQLEDMDMF